MRSAPMRFKRMPGLENVHVIRRLSFYDFENPNPKFESNIYNIDYDKALEALHAIKKNAPDYEASINTTAGVIEAQQDKQIFLQTVEGASSAACKADAFSNVNKRGHEKRLSTSVHGYTMESNAMMTRQEMLAGLAGLDPTELTQDYNFTLTDLRAFVDTHELQHASSYKNWVAQDDFEDASIPTEFLEQRPAFTKLRELYAGIRDGDEKYSVYLQENMSDTVGILHHLRAGRDIDMVQALSDARMMGHQTKLSVPYASFEVMDEIIKDEYGVRARVMGATDEQLEDMAAKLVGAYSMTRNEFHANAVVLGQRGVEVGEAYGDPKAIEDGQALEAEHMAMLTKQDLAEVQGFMATRAAKLEDREVKAYDRLVPDSEPLSVERQTVEVMAAVRHAQDMHPEFNSPQGALHLLAVRERMFAATQTEFSEDQIRVFAEAEMHYEELAEVHANLEHAPQKEAELFVESGKGEEGMSRHG